MREYSPVQGRWWTPDPAGLAAVDPNNPQTWNKYAYVGGTPLSKVDPTGMLAVVPQGCVGMPYADPTTGDYYMCPDDFGPLPGFQQPWGGGSDGNGGGGGGGGNGNQQEVTGPQRPAPQPPPQCETANNFVQRAGIAVLGWLAKFSGHTIGLGAFGTAGAGAGLGAQIGVSRQIVVSPNGTAAFVTTYTFNISPAGFVYGEGAFAGVAVSASNATSPGQLAGLSLDLSGAFAADFGAGMDVSAGAALQTTLSLGLGEGGAGGAGLFQISAVAPICGKPGDQQ